MLPALRSLHLLALHLLPRRSESGEMIKVAARRRRQPALRVLVLLAGVVLVVDAVPLLAVAGDRRTEALRLKREGETDDDAAIRINEEGKSLARDRKYYDALQKFLFALELFPLSNAIFNAGSMYHQLKQYAEAFPYLEQTLKAPLAPEQLEIVRQLRTGVLDKLKSTHRDVLLQSNPPGATIVVNGKTLPFQTPLRVLVEFGTTDIHLSASGFESEALVIEASPTKLPKDQSVRLKREEPVAQIGIRCPPGADVFIDGTMQGFEQARTRLLAGDHTIRCGKTAKSQAFERPIVVKRGIVNNFDFSSDKE